MKAMCLSRQTEVTLIGYPPSAIPALRLVAYHATSARVEVTLGRETILVPLGDLDLRHESMASLNAPQLAKDGASGHQLASAAAPTGGERAKVTA